MQVRALEDVHKLLRAATICTTEEPIEEVRQAEAVSVSREPTPKRESMQPTRT